MCSVRDEIHLHTSPYRSELTGAPLLEAMGSRVDGGLSELRIPAGEPPRAKGGGFNTLV